MTYYDLTIALHSDLPVWPGDPSIQLERIVKMEDGEHNNISTLSLCVHAGTHVDAPYHFIRDGKTIETLPLDVLIGRAQVIALPNVLEAISAEDLRNANLQDGIERLLIRTRNSDYWAQGKTTFQTDFVALLPDAAQYVVERGIKLVGIDYLSIAPYGDSIPTHLALLGAGVVVVEGVNLTGIEAGMYELYCLPLKLNGSDGAPARVVLKSL